MKSTREQFEEIWPVPDGVHWDERWGYLSRDMDSDLQDECIRMDARLETFTRCQETTDVYVSLVEELVKELEEAQPWILQDNQYMECGDLLIRAKQIMEGSK